MSAINGNAPPRYRDPYTAALGFLASEWESQHKTWQASVLRANHARDSGVREILEASAAATMVIRDDIGKRMSSVLRKHPLYPWMKAHRGFPKAVHTARLLQSIGDPLRFPGRCCAQGHYLPEDYQGSTCPLLVYAGEQVEESGKDEGSVCGAPVGSVRRGTGVRSLWHYCGLHVVDGKFPRQRKGQQGTWNPAVRDALLKPDFGIAAQLIRMSVEPWNTVYREAKERIARERGVGSHGEAELRRVPSPRAEDSGGGAEEGREDVLLIGSAAEGIAGGADVTSEIAPTGGASRGDQESGAECPHEDEFPFGPALRPIQVEKRARIIAVKAMVGDLLTEWKRLVA